MEYFDNFWRIFLSIIIKEVDWCFEVFLLNVNNIKNIIKCEVINNKKYFGKFINLWKVNKIFFNNDWMKKEIKCMLKMVWEKLKWKYGKLDLVELKES